MLLAVFVVMLVELRTCHSAEIIPRPEAAEKMLGDATAPGLAVSVDAPTKNVGELLGSNSKPDGSPEELGGFLCFGR